jgi:D-amino-acid dehydrogenase
MPGRIPEHRPYDLIVVGGGIIGVTTALYLVRAGKSVALIEPNEIAGAASSGNAGALAFSDILPLASPGIFFKAPKWLLDPLGPLAIPFGEVPAHLPWLLRFFRASLPDRVEASTKAQAALNGLARREMQTLIADTDLQHFIHSEGCLHLYESEDEWRRSAPGWNACKRFGIAFEHVEGAALAALQPGLSRLVVKATYVPGWQVVTDPRAFSEAIFRSACSAGLSHVIGKVSNVVSDETGVQLNLADGAILKAGKVVIAAGPWSGDLSAQLGDTLPLIAERGYNTTLPKDAFDLRKQLILGGHGFVISPLADGIRIGGASELARFPAPVNFKRSAHMLSKAALFLEGLKTEGGTQWMGSRPSMPDSTPVIGTASASQNVIYAFGHGHLGLTQSAATARLITDIALDRPPAISLHPYRPDRF